MTAAEAKSGRYTYYICHSLLKQGKGTCDTPRLNAKAFEGLIIEQLRENVLTESNIRALVKLVDEEMDGVAHEQRQRLETIEAELEEVKRKLARIWQFVESTDIEMADAADRIKEHRERQAQLEDAAQEARAELAARRGMLDSADTIAAFAEEMGEFLKTSELTETRAFVRSFVKGSAGEAGPGRHHLHHPHAGGQSHRGSGRLGDSPEWGCYELGTIWWAWMDSNQRPQSYQDCALTA